MTKYIFVTGGVLSSLGKGISSASIAALLRNSGLKVSMLKIDPYINVDPGTMSPIEHGEVFVTADGGETDLDIGHYERFTNTTLSKKNNFTTGQVYQTVIERERKGDYAGKTIQVVPHITDEIIKRIKNAGKDQDVLVVELGGTVGDIEGLPFYESVRQIKHIYRNRVFNVHVTLVPYIAVADELKTKPTQHSVQELRRIGITPDMLIVRSEKPVSRDIRKKLSNSCDVDFDSVIEASDAKSIYELPLKFYDLGILKPIAKALDLGDLKPDLKEWKKLAKQIIEPKNSTKIAIVGKYLELKESYKSLTESLVHAGAHLDTKVDIKWIDSETLDETNLDQLSDANAVLVPGGFGSRGIDGKIAAIKYAREHKKVFLGICLGMQLTVVEFARNVLGIKDANSEEFDPASKNLAVKLRQNQSSDTMRLGEFEVLIKSGTKLSAAYSDQPNSKERYRHRYEINNDYREKLESAGVIVSAEAKGQIEAIELSDQPWFVAVQFHPEFTSRLQSPNPLIVEFVKNSF